MIGNIEKPGRPRKFHEEELLDIVKNYIENNHDETKPIKVTKLAEGLKNEGYNVIYQDLNRYKNVKEYIQNYNLKFKKSDTKEVKSDKKNVGGRPRKFIEEELYQAVKGYILGWKRARLIKLSEVAKHFQEKNIDVTYQDLKRYKKVNDFIEEYNRNYKESLFKNLMTVDIENEVPTFMHIDTKEFLKQYKTREDIEEAILTLNTSNEKLVENTEKLQHKILLQNEKILDQSLKIEKLKSEIKYLTNKHEIEEKELKEQNKKSKEKILKLNKTISIYDQFIDRYHYSNLAEYAICLEQNIEADGIKVIGGFIDEEKYASGNFSLREIADKYFSFQLAVENAITEYLKNTDTDDNNENIFKIDDEDIARYVNRYGKGESSLQEEVAINEAKPTGIESINVEIEDLDNFLNFEDI